MADIKLGNLLYKDNTAPVDDSNPVSVKDEQAKDKLDEVKSELQSVDGKVATETTLGQIDQRLQTLEDTVDDGLQKVQLNGNFVEAPITALNVDLPDNEVDEYLIEEDIVLYSFSINADRHFRLSINQEVSSPFDDRQDFYLGHRNSGRGYPQLRTESVQNEFMNKLEDPFYDAGQMEDGEYYIVSKFNTPIRVKGGLNFRIDSTEDGIMEYTARIIYAKAGV